MPSPTDVDRCAIALALSVSAKPDQDGAGHDSGATSSTGPVGALHALAWWLAATNRWLTTARCVLRRPTMPRFCSRFRRRRGENSCESARLRLREEPSRAMGRRDRAPPPHLG